MAAIRLFTIPAQCVPGAALRDRARRSDALRCSRRRRCRAAVVLGTVVLVLGTLMAPARAAPSPTPAPHPTSSAPAPSDTSSPCASADCIPQPTASTKSGSTPQPTSTSQDGDEGGEPGGITGWISKGITSAINSFFRGIVNAALNPLLDLLGQTLLTTPSPSSLPRIGELWANSWQIVLASYALLVSAAGVVVMAHETVQTRYSVKEIAPRIPLGFLAAGLSLFLAGKAVDLANALSQAVMGEGLDANTAGDTLRAFVFGGLNANGGSIFFVLIGLVLAGSLLALLVCYVVRLALTVILIASAPLALMCHALPQTDGIARWWWKAFGGVLAIQVAQSLALITSMRLFLTPGGFNMFGPTRSGLVNLIVALALFYILLKIPFWILGSLRFSHRRSFVGGLARAYVAYKTFGILRGSGGSPGHATPAGGQRRTPPPGGPGGRPTSPRPSGTSPSSGSRRPGGDGSSPAQPGRAAGRTLRRPLGPPLFLQPTSAAPSSTAPTGQAGGPPPMPEFRSPDEPRSGHTGAPSRPRPRPTGPPGLPVFQAPAGGAAQRSGATGHGAGTPTRRTQQQPAAPPSARQVRAGKPPMAATFRPPVAETSARPRPPRTSPPPAATFRSPQASSQPPPKRTQSPPRDGDRRRRGGDHR